jgi:hypothetical protein
VERILTEKKTLTAGDPAAAQALRKTDAASGDVIVIHSKVSSRSLSGKIAWSGPVRVSTSGISNVDTPRAARAAANSLFFPLSRVKTTWGAAVGKSGLLDARTPVTDGCFPAYDDPCIIKYPLVRLQSAAAVPQPNVVSRY